MHIYLVISLLRDNAPVMTDRMCCIKQSALWALKIFYNATSDRVENASCLKITRTPGTSTGKNLCRFRGLVVLVSYLEDQNNYPKNPLIVEFKPDEGALVFGRDNGKVRRELRGRRNVR